MYYDLCKSLNHRRSPDYIILGLLRSVHNYTSRLLQCTYALTLPPIILFSDFHRACLYENRRKYIGSMALMRVLFGLKLA